jgi:hypothetical protein
LFYHLIAWELRGREGRFFPEAVCRKRLEVISKPVILYPEQSEGILAVQGSVDLSSFIVAAPREIFSEGYLDALPTGNIL